MSDKEIRLYVSCEGNDKWSGRLSSPNGSDGPLASIFAARDAIRALKKSEKLINRKVKILLRGGIYHLNKTLLLSPEDSGLAQAPIIYAAYPGEVPVISGGRRITGWTITTLKGRSCWSVELPDVKSGKWYFTQLFVNGRRMPRPRLPKKGYYEFTGLAGADRVTPDWTMHGPRKANFAPGHIRNWKNLSDIEVIVLARWYDSHNHIDKVDEKSNTVFFKKETMGSLFDDGATPSGYSRYCLENVFETLDTPGEWHLDRHAGKLFYLPMATQKMDTTEIIAPCLSEIVRLQGSKNGDPVEHIRFENMAFQHAEWVLPADDPGSVQAAFKVPGAIVFDGAENCVLYGCSVSMISQYGVELLAGCANNKIVGCSMSDMGAGGVKIGHDELLREGDTNPKKTAPPAKRLKFMRTTVSDCLIHDGGIIYPGAIGLWIGNSGHNIIRHNHIFNIPYTGISCGWTWGFDPTRTFCNVIENNHVHHIGNLLHDNGGIYLLGKSPGTIVSGNLIHDIVNYGRLGAGGQGFYPDEGSSMITFENNIVYRTAGKPFNLHFGYDNCVRNNIFVLPENMFIAIGNHDDSRYTSVFTKNIFLQADGAVRLEQAPRQNSKFEKNLFWRADSQPSDLVKQILDREAQKGQHAGSIVADPLFTDPAGGDFSLREDSPAAKIGFKPIDISKVGPRFQACRPVSYDDFSKRCKTDHRHTRGILLASLEPIGLFYRSGTPCETTVRLVVENIGDETACGRIRVAAGPGKSAIITGKARYAFTLMPGRKAQAKFTVIPEKTADRIYVEAIAGNSAISSASLHVEKLQRKEWKIKRGPSIGNPGLIKKLLDDCRPLFAKVFHLDYNVAEIRMAVSGANLAIHAAIMDKQIKTATPPWNASCLVLFCSTPNSKKVIQLNLQPPKTGKSALATIFDQHSCVPANEIGTLCVPANKIKSKFSLRPDGYELCALVPFASLSIEENPKTFLMEFLVITALSETGLYQSFGVFEHSCSPSNNAAYGLITIEV